jgi:hypothetical protein
MDRLYMNLCSDPQPEAASLETRPCIVHSNQPRKPPAESQTGRKSDQATAQEAKQ